MKLISAEVNWMHGWANRPNLVLTVDNMPEQVDLRYQRKDNLYWAELDGYVQFFAHSPGNESGFGGHVFDLTLTDGEQVSIRGPWSSRASAMNNHFPHCVDVTLYTEDGGRFAASVTLALAKEAAKLAGVELKKEKKDS